MTNQQFVQLIDGAVRAELPQLVPASRLLVVAHACLESGWGHARAFLRGYNAFNLTAGPAWRGAEWTDVDGDTDGPTGKKITQVWRAYSSINDAVRDYWSFLGLDQNGGRYTKARAQLESAEPNVGEFAALLWKAGYFTANPLTYAQDLTKIRIAVAKLLGAPPAAPTP